MSAAGIKVATTTTPNTHTVAAADECDVRIKTTTNSEADCALYSKIGAENSSFSTLNSLKEQLTSSCSANELQQNKVPLENSQLNNRQLRENEAEENSAAPNRDLSSEFPNNHLQQGDLDNTSATQLSPGLSLLQQTAAASSPPPHSYRHSRAYRHFKNPPQPHMCIRTTTEAGEELFINVLSWTRIVIPQEPSDPIPLYGGMRVPPGSPRSPPIVFAVMANPEVLKDSGRHSKDPEERRAMVELMCDFVEAMNPGVKLVRNAVILKDRDISGELKDVWNAVQAQRDREREEQMLLQRQQHQQHFHNLTNASTNGSLNANTSLSTANNSANATATSQQMFPKSVHSGAAGEAMLMAVDGGTPPRSRKIIHEVQNDNNASNTDIEMDIDMQKANNSQLSLALLAEHLDNKMSLVVDEEQGEENQQTQQQNNQNTLTNDALSNGNNSKDSLVQERGNKMDINNQLNAINCNKDSKQQQQPALTNGTVANCNDMEVTNVTKTIIATSTPPNATISAIPAQNPSTTTTNTAAPTPIPAPTPQAPTKKEKLGGFLPNGCIFPRFTKNNKHKDKDKDKEKETKTKDKEKNVLLSALKKSKDKKTNSTTAAAAAAAAAALAANQDEKITSSNSNTTAATTPNCTQTNNKQQKQNCLQQLECGVQKLDLNNHHHHNQAHTNDNNINNTANTTTTNNTSATNKSNSTTSSTSGVGVH
ncbi:ankyrin repeat-containing protein kinase A [Calliphora vicina]|uniref:ankyrin repeat-containing protein kinase A n=1 Tax=Calliphora vicina TaxID=7373 RepID=UPI00325A79E7